MDSKTATRLIGDMIAKPAKKKRTNWKAEMRKERGKVLGEAISHLTAEVRNVPEPWRRGYWSAITQLEIMKANNG